MVCRQLALGTAKVVILMVLGDILVSFLLIPIEVLLRWGPPIELMGSCWLICPIEAITGSIRLLPRPIGLTVVSIARTTVLGCFLLIWGTFPIESL